MATRSPERIEAHYQIERSLADRLRNASSDERQGLYTQVYDELFQRVPDHPQLHQKNDPDADQRRMLGQAKFLYSLLNADSTYLEIGPGDCDLARHIASKVRQVYAVDVSNVIGEGDPFPENMQFALSDGRSVPVPSDSVDVAFSNQLMEHLHPDDALDQLRNVYAALAPGGAYLCITPSRFSGPHDISYHFDREATGLHLKEYSYSELIDLFRSVGFRKFRIIVGYRGVGFQCSPTFGVWSERLVTALPISLGRKVARFPILRLLLGVKLIAIK